MLFCILNAVMRGLTLQIDPFQAQFLRYLAGFIVIVPLVLRSGSIRAWWPRRVGGQFMRGALHTAGITLWFIAPAPHSARRHDGDRLHHADLHHAGSTARVSRADALGAVAGVCIRLCRGADRRRAEALGNRRRLQPRDARVFAALRRLVPGHQGADPLREQRRDPAVAGDHRDPAQPADGSAALAGTEHRPDRGVSRCAGCSAAAPTIA